MKVAILLMTFLVSHPTLAVASCLWDQPGEYPAEDLLDTEKEQIDLARQQIASLSDIESLRAKGEILKGIPNFLPIILMSNSGEDNPCHIEYAEFLESQIFEQSPIHFDPLLLALIETIGKMPDFRTVMPIKARVLINLFESQESAFTAWQDPETVRFPEPEPVKRDIRLLVAKQMANSNLVLNHERYRSVLADTSLTSYDSQLHVILFPEYKKLLDFYLVLGDGSEIAHGNRILSDKIARVPGNLGMISPHLSDFENLLYNFEMMGLFANHYDLRDEALSVIDEVVDAHGNFPLTSNVFDGPRQLLIKAQQTRIELDH